MLQFENIKLRPIKISDLENLNIWKNDYEVFKYLGGGFNPQSIDQQRSYLDKLIDMSNDKRFIIEYDKMAIGLVGIYGINNRDRSCDFGIYIGNKNFWGKGIGKVTTELIINYAFKNLNLRKIKLLVVSENRQAIKLYESLKFYQVGTFKKDRFIDGEYKDVLIMELINEEN